MSDIVPVRNRMENLDVSPRFDNYTKVIIHVSDEIDYVAGKDGGRVLEIENPFGTQSMANDMLNRLKGYRYQPYDSDGTLIDPAAEMGDALNATNVFGGIYTRNRTFGRLMKADVSAPEDEEVDSEYTYDNPEHREFIRATANLKEYTRASFEVAQNAITAEVERANAAEGSIRATLAVHADEINARVVADNSANRQSFGWKLTSSSWEVYSNNETILKATRSGLEVKGKITATSGKIGGFDLTANDFSSWEKGRDSYETQRGITISPSTGIKFGWVNAEDEENPTKGWYRFSVDTNGNIKATSGKIGGFNISDWDLYNWEKGRDSNEDQRGITISPNGISMGWKNSESVFRVDSAGNIKATSLTLRGNITFQNDDGTYAGSLSAANLLSKTNYSYGQTTSGGYCYGGAYSWNNAKVGKETISYLSATSIGCTRFYFNNKTVGTQYITYTDGNGNSRSATFLTIQ